jgi:pilus assembly protein CpaF
LRAGENVRSTWRNSWNGGSPPQGSRCPPAGPAVEPRADAEQERQTAAAASAAPAVAAQPAPQPKAPEPAPEKPVQRRSNDYYATKASIFNALVEAIDLSMLTRLSPEDAREEIRDVVSEIIALKNLAMSIAEQEMTCWRISATM